MNSLERHLPELRALPSAVLRLFTSCRGANDKIVLALIGAGGRGVPTIISCCKSNVNVTIKTVCDVNDLRSASAASEIEKQLGYKPLTTRYMKEVFDDREVDAVWISTPDHWHALATIWACQAGKDVYVEKTPGLCIWEGSKMAEAAKKYRTDRSGRISKQKRCLYCIGT